MSSGRELHMTGPETRKLLAPKRRVLVRGVVRCLRAAERRWALASISEMGMQDWLRDVGPRPWNEFRTKVAILKMMRWWIGSQWRWSLSTGGMWSNFPVLVISLAPGWEQIAIFVGQLSWLRRICCCSSPRDLIQGNGPMSSRLAQWVIVWWIAAVSAGRSSFLLCCWHAGPFPVLDRKSLPDSLQRLRISCGVPRFVYTVSRSLLAVAWT